MSTLSQLVKLRNDLESTLIKLSLVDHITEKINIINSVKIKNNINDYNQDIFEFNSRYEKLIHDSNSIIKDIEVAIEKINNDIDNSAKKVFNTPVFNQLLPTNTDIESILKLRISKYSDWKFPGLQICRYISKNDWRAQANQQEFANGKDQIDCMLACDPLYLLGYDIKALEDIISPFPEVYRKRLRLYELKNKNLNVIPQNQFSFILCWDFLNYLPIDDVNFYLKELIKVLRPGGVLFFSYNNCDIENSAESAEKSKACWATKRQIKNIVLNLEYEIIKFEDMAVNDLLNSYVSWAEIRKPGELKTVRAHQAIAQILTK